MLFLSWKRLTQLLWYCVIYWWLCWLWVSWVSRNCKTKEEIRVELHSNQVIYSYQCIIQQYTSYYPMMCNWTNSIPPSSSSTKLQNIRTFSSYNACSIFICCCLLVFRGDINTLKAEWGERFPSVKLETFDGRKRACCFELGVSAKTKQNAFKAAFLS